MAGSRNGRLPARAALGALVRSSQQGDPSAMDQLTAAVRPWLEAYFEQRCFSPLEARSLAETGSMRLLLAVDRIAPPEQVVEYLRVIAQHQVRIGTHGHDVYHSVEGTVSPSASLSRPAPTVVRHGVTNRAGIARTEPGDPLAHDVTKVQAVARAIAVTVPADMPRTLRELIDLFSVGRTHEEVAALLEITPAAVTARVQRMEGMLAQRLAGYLGEPSISPASRDHTGTELRG